MGDELKSLARHEAAHAVVCHALGVKVHSIELSQNGDGVCWHDGPSELLDKGHDATSVAIAHGKIAAAGRAAAPDTAYSANDNDGFQKAFWLCGLSDVSFFVFRDASHALAKEIVRKHEDKVERVADALMKRGVLSNIEFAELMK